MRCSPRCYPSSGFVSISSTASVWQVASYESLWHVEGVHDGVHYGRINALVTTEEEAVRSFTLVRLSEYVTEIHVHVESEASALMRIHCVSMVACVL